MSRPGFLRSAAWAAAAVAFAALLLATLSVAPKVWYRVLPLLQPNVSLAFVLVGAAAAALLSAWAWRSPRRRPAALALLALVLAAYVALLFTFYRGEAPAKKVHLLEYGLLAGLTLQAVRLEADRRAGVVAAALFLFAVGTADEVWQGFLPTRTFRWTDLLANYMGASLGAAAWWAASPLSPWRRGSR